MTQPLEDKMIQSLDRFFVSDRIEVEDIIDEAIKVAQEAVLAERQRCSDLAAQHGMMMDSEIAFKIANHILLEPVAAPESDECTEVVTDGEVK